MKEKKLFKDVNIGEFFYDDKTFKKMSYDYAKDIFTYEFVDFYPMDLVKVDKKTKFQLNF